jgi:hypothetical protein
MKLLRKLVSLEISAFQITPVVDTDFIVSDSPELRSGLPDYVPSGLRSGNRPEDLNLLGIKIKVPEPTRNAANRLDWSAQL